jgi:hypothetical protein
VSDEAKRYNGWKNYETWAVHLWMSNDEGSYCYWSDEAAVHLGEAPEHEHVQGGIWTAAEAARFTLGAQMKSEIEEGSPIEGASLYSDLLSAALSEVDWSEIADAFLADVEPEEDDQADEE